MPRTKAPNRVQLWRANLAEICRERAEHLRLVLVMRAAQHGPKPLLAEITAFSPDQQDEFGFNMYEPSKPWYWQSEFVDDIMEHNALLVLKARQLGATWVAASIALWYMLFRPGSYCLLFSYTQEEAKEVIARVWTMYQSLPPYLRSHVTVITPDRSDEPSEWIRVRHKNGRISKIRALPATKKHGRSLTATYIVMDEAAYQDYCKQIYTSTNPVIARGGKLVIVSTANGVGNPDTEEGNFFYILYHTRDVRKLKFIFLPWNLHPERDEEWYQNVAMRLPEQERNQEYPLTPRDAFILSGALFFDRDSLHYYAGKLLKPKHQGQFFMLSNTQAQFMELSDGAISVLQLPRPDGAYAIGTDTATERGQDNSSAHVIDMETGQVVAEMWAHQWDSVRWAEQMYFLGRWYNDALIAVELGGGYGDSVIIALRDGGSGRRPYKNLYTHRTVTKKGKPKSERYGFPITAGSRKTILDGLQFSLMQRQPHGVTLSTLDEMNAFVYQTTPPSPRAQEGMHDDRVMSYALAQEIYRQKGNRPSADKRKKAMRSVNQRQYQPPAVKAGG